MEILMHNIVLQYYMKMKNEQKRIYKKSFISIKKQQKMEILILIQTLVKKLEHVTFNQ